MNIKDKLRELERVPRPLKTGMPKPRLDRLQQLLGGFEQDGCFVVERRHALHEPYGSTRLADLLDLSGAVLSIAAKDEQLNEVPLAQTLIVDTETTGLAGGAGTLAFLVGLGYFENDSFVVRQYFLRQPHEESAMLTALQRHVAQSRGLISFNGKSFDIPLLLTRTVLNRIRIDLASLPHFDVLHASRRLWKARLQDCSLGNLEHRILGIQRAEDVPSALIPQIYFDFVRYGKTEQLAEVLAHNRQDIVTTAALLVRIGQIVQAPFKFSGSREELRQIGKLYREAGELDTSIKLFEELALCRREDDALDDYLALGFCYKSQRRYEEANRIWQHMIEFLPFHPLPFIEIAKHLEHRQRDHRAALAIVHRALHAISLVEELQRQKNWMIYKDDLLRREGRLRKKREAAMVRSATELTHMNTLNANETSEANSGSAREIN